MQRLIRLGHKASFTAFAALYFALLHPTAAGAATAPSWQMLHFEAKSMWATARTKLSLVTHDSDKFGEVWELQLHGSVSSSSERENVLMTPGSGALLERDRFTKGKNQRLKHYEYEKQTIVRIRREPGEGAAAQLPPWEWPVSNKKTLSRPSSEDCPVLTAIPSLLIFASMVPEAPGQKSAICVHTDQNFYRVSMAVEGEEKLAVNYKLGKAEKKVKAKIATTVIALTVERVGNTDGDPDFSILGLSSPAFIILDKETGLPVQVRGQAPRLGNTKINLIAANQGPESPH